MLYLLPAVLLALTPPSFDSGRVALAQDKQDAAKRQDLVRDFVKAFFREDEKTLLALSSGRLQSDLKAYFWIRRRIHGEKAAEPGAWNGEIKILRSARRKVFETEGRLAESEAEIFELTVDGKPYQCGLDDRGLAILFSDPPK